MASCSSDSKLDKPKPSVSDLIHEWHASGSRGVSFQEWCHARTNPVLAEEWKKKEEETRTTSLHPIYMTNLREDVSFKEWISKRPKTTPKPPLKELLEEWHVWREDKLAKEVPASVPMNLVIARNDGEWTIEPGEVVVRVSNGKYMSLREAKAKKLV